jgi:circadian clock protein KaiC
VLANREANGERIRTIRVIKARGMPHSNQVREFVIGPGGIELVDIYRSEGRAMIGSARSASQARRLPGDADGNEAPLPTADRRPRGRRAEG